MRDLTREQMAADYARSTVKEYDKDLFGFYQQALTWNYHYEATAKNDEQRKDAVVERREINALLMELTRAYNMLTIQQQNHLKISSGSSRAKIPPGLP